MKSAFARINITHPDNDMTGFTSRKIIMPLLMMSCLAGHAAEPDGVILSGRVTANDRSTLAFAQVYLKNTTYKCTANAEGLYHLTAPAGKYTLVVHALGYEPVEMTVTINGRTRTQQNVTMRPRGTELGEAVITATGVSRVQRSAYNATAISTETLRNSTKTLSDALAKAPGVKLRETGGVGSDTQVMMDGFSGKHVKVFIDGVPQEGVGSSFGLNNIPAGYAKRIEVYRGVVPVGFGTDAMGGVVNIVTERPRAGWQAGASYSFGSFNTHRSDINFSHTLNSGFTYQVTAFQNYSDNDYHVYAPVENFETGAINKNKKERVKRFHDTYHNEAVTAKVGFVEQRWADRLLLGFTYAHQYKELQTGVRQEIVYGQKHRHGYSLMPSLEYAKRNLLTRGLDLTLTLNYNRNVLTNVDTATVKYNWRGETSRLNSPGEQSYLYSRADNDNWNATATVKYRIGRTHFFTLNHVLNTFSRHNTSLLAKEAASDPIGKRTNKNITGFSYQFAPSEKWNATAFGKAYRLFTAGPMATNSNATAFERTTRSQTDWGYGAAGTYFILPELQAKISYERALRLPTIEELFGDEDLETGSVTIRPEKSHNVNVNLSYAKQIGKNGLYAEAGFVYRNISDYIQRNITDLSGGRSGATYVNYGRVLTKGFNLTARYSWGKWVSVGGNFTQMDVRDNMKQALGSTKENLGYKQRMPNLPYLFADMDLTLHWHDLGAKGNVLSLTYDTRYVKEFSYYSQLIGSNKGDFMVPDQLSHNLTLTYSLGKGRYNLAFECKNLTDERLYDNFSLQKAGRAFYGKLRINLGTR